MTKHTLLPLILASLLLPPAIPAWAAPVRTLQKDQNYSELVSKRQVVEQLLADAWQIYTTPASLAGAASRMPSHMEQISERLLQAYQLEPYRTDLLISAANAQIDNGNVSKAIALFEQALATAPQDLDLLTYLATWQTFKGNSNAAQGYLTRLADLNGGRATELQRIFTTIARIRDTPLKEQGEGSPKAGNRAIVTLGSPLNDDGTMTEILLGRLEATRSLAQANPAALIILTGGIPKNRQTAGRLMADWLVKKGIDRSRIIEDNYATDTVENAIYSSYVLARHQIRYATLVSSASQVRRGQTLLEIASWQSGPAGLQIDSVGYPDQPLSALTKAGDSELLGIYRDALRTYGLWRYRAAPLLAR